MENEEFDKVARLIKSFERTLYFVPDAIKSETYDIRLKSGQPLMLTGKRGTLFVNDKGGVSHKIGQDTLICRQEDIKEVFFQVCSHSVFSHENEIKEGFVTAGNGYRVGLCGTAVLEKGSIKNIKDVSSLVFRIPREKKGCADKLFQSGIDFSAGILIVGEPSSGKTTFLRDACVSLSYGLHTRSKRIAVLDERSEISGRFDLGPCADILKGYPKADGLIMALRALSPEMIICDEISDKEVESVHQALFSGVPVIATLHGSEKDLYGRKALKEILRSGGFETLVFLRGREQPTEILKIESVREWFENSGRDDDSTQRFDYWNYESGKA
ncbi:ATPase, T2SS/T4P/T4SS family [Scatolibacter rhodanostii]|uniref:ATPase, T2SS/T4P/T4SS family n=1 Tax=Scatolibacter rhodanostii TaxID=2014781 RepID=UPI000C086177|nr:ATPase, T2SS/T4P/T4SS family [Scatolibacter rhodanostii]